MHIILKKNFSSKDDTEYKFGISFLFSDDFSEDFQSVEGKFEQHLLMFCFLGSSDIVVMLVVIIQMVKIPQSLWI